MKTDLHQCAANIARAITQPRLRRELHYECGLYKNDHDRAPMAALHLDHTCTTPLVKLLAVMAAGMLAMWAVCGMIGWWRRIFCRDACDCGCDCH